MDYSVNYNHGNMHNMNLTSDEECLVDTIFRMISENKDATETKLHLEKRSDSYTSVICGKYNDFLRFKFTNRAKWISIRLRSEDMDPNNELFKAQKNKNQLHWKANISCLEDIYLFKDYIIRACVNFEGDMNEDNNISNINSSDILYRKVKKVNEREKGTRLEEFIEDYVVLDLETTSANISNAKIIEVAAIKVKNGKVVETFESLVNPREKIPRMATSVNHITDDMVKDSPYIEEVLERFMKFIEGEILLGHNITTFDLNILYDIMQREFNYILNNDFIDTLYLSQKCNDCVDNYKLQTLSEYYGLDVQGEHRALKDCYLTNMCYLKLKEEYDAHGFVRCSKTKKGGTHKVRYSEETKSLQELQGFLMGIMADDILTVSEVEKLNLWMQNNTELKGNYPFDRVYEALEDVLEDGIIEPKELKQLEKVFKEFISPTDQCEEIVVGNLTNKHCCLTGEFEAGSKAEIGKKIEMNGGICDSTVKKCTDYLVVGALGSQSWKQGTYGGKIKKAMEMKDKGSSIQVIAENSFLQQLQS